MHMKTLALVFQAENCKSDHIMQVEVEKKDSLKNKVISDCFAFCMSLNISLYGAMTVSIPIFQPYAQRPFQLLKKVVTQT
jgi:hypothetical protein